MQGSATDSDYREISISEFLGWMPVNKPSYVVPENFWKMWVFWSEPDDPGCSETINNWSVASRIRSALSEFNLLFCPIMLVQFWSPETVGDRRVLSTSRQPFALPAFRQGLCRYRVHSLTYKFIVDDQEQQDRNINPSTHDVSGEEEEQVVVGGAVLVRGPPSRVFSSHLPEYSLDVRSYSIKDHPLLETANLHNLPAAYFTLPVFEPHTENCAGVLEIVLLDNIYLDISGVLPEIKRSLEVWDLETFCAHEFLQSQTIAGLENATDEIREVLKMACESHNLPLAQAWIGLPYIHKNPTRSGGVLIHKLVEFMNNHYWEYQASMFSSACELRPLTEGEGLVGNVLSTHKPYFCEDVSLLSLTEYPLSSYARKASLTSCFAICLRSTITGNHEYVLELFLPYTGDINTTSKKHRLQALLSSIINTMKQHFQTFNVASGEQLGEEISVRLITDSMNDQVPASFNICQATSPCPPIAPQALEPAGGVEVAQHIDDPTKHALETLANSEQSETMMQRRSSTVTSVKSHRTSKISLNLGQIQSQYGRSLKEAAENLGVSPSTLKRECRSLDIMRWPAAHKRKKRKKMISSPYSSNLERGDGPRGITDQQDMNDPGSSSKGGQVTSFGADSRYVHDMTANDTPTYQNISPMRLVTMEAAYGDYTIRFRLSTSSTTTDLNEEIIKRLQPLRDRPYSITYEDDKRKQILIACDEDLQDLIMSRSSDDEIKILVSAITTTNQAPVQNESGLTVKASDGNETIKFQLSSSSTFASVEDKIAKSLDLVTGTFRLKYEDEEDELISIKNDEHLRECMSSSRGLNRTTIRMSVQRLENR